MAYNITLAALADHFRRPYAAKMRGPPSKPRLIMMVIFGSATPIVRRQSKGRGIPPSACDLPTRFFKFSIPTFVRLRLRRTSGSWPCQRLYHAACPVQTSGRRLEGWQRRGRLPPASPDDGVSVQAGHQDEQRGFCSPGGKLTSVSRVL